MITSVDIASILEGGHFTFIVGLDERHFVVHSALVSKHSKPLGSMINNGMKESQVGAVTLDDIESATFAIFAQYLYASLNRSNNSQTPDLELQELSILIATREVRQKQSQKHPDGFWFRCRYCSKSVSTKGADTAYPFHTAICRKESISYRPACSDCGVKIAPTKFLCKDCEEKNLGSKPVDKYWHQFKTRFEAAGTQKEDTTSNDIPQPPAEILENLSMHAKVWVFADRYSVFKLRQQSLRKVHLALVAHDLKAESVKDVVELLEFVYEHTRSPEAGTGGEDAQSCELRDLVITYAVCKAEILVASDDFCTMLQGEGELASDYAKALVKRLA